MTYQNLNDVPSPVVVAVCSVCGLNWQKHIDKARSRAMNNHYNEEKNLAGIQGFNIIKPFDYETEVEITTLDCIELLKNVNQGPIGLTGMAGVPGPKGDSFQPQLAKMR